MSDFEKIWTKILKFEGKNFSTITGLKFTYLVKNNFLVSDRAKFKLSKENFESAYKEWPVDRPSYFSKGIFGKSYVWGIFNDNRILKK